MNTVAGILYCARRGEMGDTLNAVRYCRRIANMRGEYATDYQEAANVLYNEHLALLREYPTNHHVVGDAGSVPT